MIPIIQARKLRLDVGSNLLDSAKRVCLHVSLIQMLVLVILDRQLSC